MPCSPETCCSRCSGVGGDRIRRRGGGTHRDEAVGSDPSWPSCGPGSGPRSTPGRPEATERRHARGRRTARENIEDLCDPGSFEEYGGLVIAAQRARRSVDGPAAPTRRPTGLIAGIGRVNGDLFGDDARCAVLSYDYTVLAGTQGQMNHRKKDRLFELVERLRLPVVLFAEGGGGRPGDTDTAVGHRSRHRSLRPVRRPEREGAAGRRRVGPLLRRQRRPAGLLPRHHRHPRRQHRDGRARP